MSIRSLVNSSLERSISSKPTSPERVENEAPYTNLQLTIAATLSAPFFSIMFGGNFYDAIGAGIATVFAFAFLLSLKYVRIPFATAFAAAFVFGFLAHIWTRYSGFPSNTDLYYRRLCHALRSWNRHDQCCPRSDELPPQLWDEQTL